MSRVYCPKNLTFILVEAKPKNDSLPIAISLIVNVSFVRVGSVKVAKEGVTFIRVGK
jgi:hypothetical protein